MYYSAAVVGLNTSAFLEAAVVGKPVHTVLVDEISRDNQEGTIHFHYLLDVNGGLLRVARTLDEHCRLLADSLAAEGGGDVKAERFVEGFIRPFGRDRSGHAAFRRCDRAAGSSPAPRPAGAADRPNASSGCRSIRPLARCRLLLATQPHRKRARLEVQQVVPGRPSPRVREAEAVRAEPARREGAGGRARSVPPSALTPKPGRQRDPAKKLAGWNLPEAEETRELVTALGRSGRPILIGPWLSEAGFELLYWIPFLAWAKAYGNLDPVAARRRLARRRGVVVSRHHDQLRGRPLLLHARRVPRRATTRASSSSAGG